MPVMKSRLASLDLYKFHGLLHYLLWVAAGAEESLEPPSCDHATCVGVKVEVPSGAGTGAHGGVTYLGFWRAPLVAWVVSRILSIENAILGLGLSNPPFH